MILLLTDFSRLSRLLLFEVMIETIKHLQSRTSGRKVGLRGMIFFGEWVVGIVRKEKSYMPNNYIYSQT